MTKSDQIRQLYDGVRTTREIAEIVGCLPEYVRVVARQKRAANTRYAKRRYHSDPEFRAKIIARNAAYLMRRYREDPEYRARLLAYKRDWWRKRAEVHA